MFYVYAHLDPSSNEVRYIGKGKDRRAWSFSHRKGHHGNWINKLKKLGLKPIVQILFKNLSEEDAFKKEKELIKSYTNLTNLTDGGEGVSGYSPSEEFKEWIKEYNTGKKQTAEQIENMAKTKRGKPRSPKVRESISKGCKGIKFSSEHKHKMSLAHLGLKQTPEHIAKIIAKNTGRKRTIQQKANMRLAWVKRKLLKLGAT